jgi:phospholipid/cholesterol/gamma-HCH transport system substrate-binding protein
MEQRTSDIKLGLFAIVGTGLFVLGLLAFGARNLVQHATIFETYVDGDVTGLSVGSPVELRGVRVGKVKTINFSWNLYEENEPAYVVIRFEIEDSVTPLPPGKERSQMIKTAIQRGLRARLKSQGITGTSLLSLEYLNAAENPPVPYPWTPKYSYIPAAPSEFTELLAALEKTLHNLEKFDFHSVDQLLEGDLKAAGRTLDHVNEIDFRSMGTNANGLLVDLRGSNARLKMLIDTTRETEQKLKLEKLSSDLDGLVVDLQATVAGLRPGLSNIDFDALNQTLINARRALKTVDDAVAELKQYPSGFLFGKPPERIKLPQPTPPK